MNQGPQGWGQPGQGQCGHGGAPQQHGAPHGWQGGPSPAPKPKASPALVAGLVGGGLVVLVGLALLLRSAAHKQESTCAGAVQAASSTVAAGAPNASRAAIQVARDACKSLRADELAALEASVTKQEADAKAKAGYPALLAAGYKPEQLARASILPICKAKDRMPVEMVASNVAGEPRYWDCDRNVLFQERPQTPADCEAKKLEFTTTRDENGKDVGACKMSAERLDEDRLRKACKVGPAAKIQPADSAEVIAMCRMAVERVLKAPKSAEHPGIFDQDGKPASKDGCTTIYASWVDAQNAFGATIRTRYVCTYDPRTGVASTTTL